jgi:hypothetical protein
MPSVRLTGIAAGNSDSIEVRLAVFNPNRQGVELGRTEYALLVGSETLASGARTAPVVLGARDSVELALPLSVRLGRVLGMLPGALDDTAECRFSGEYTVPTLLGRRHDRFGQAFRFPVREQLQSIWDGLLGSGKNRQGGD